VTLYNCYPSSLLTFYDLLLQDPNFICLIGPFNLYLVNFRLLSFFQNSCFSLRLATMTLGFVLITFKEIMWPVLFQVIFTILQVLTHVSYIKEQSGMSTSNYFCTLQQGLFPTQQPRTKEKNLLGG
jgi:hypothetical protein